MSAEKKLLRIGELLLSMIHQMGECQRSTIRGVKGPGVRAENRRLSIGPEGRTLADRCLMSGGAGPPLVPGAYNNNIQIVQTKRSHHDSERDDTQGSYNSY